MNGDKKVFTIKQTNGIHIKPSAERKTTSGSQCTQTQRKGERSKGKRKIEDITMKNEFYS
jgi:phosphotransferase system HPr-like phosphotransfer protein